MPRVLVAAACLALAPAAFAQPPVGARALTLTVDQAVALALDHNVDLTADRFDPRISDTRVAAARGAFWPVASSTVLRNNQLQPPSSFLIPIPTRNDIVTSSVGVGQRLPLFGTSYSLSWDSSHTTSNSILNSYNPLVRSGMTFSVSQPLLRDFLTDGARLQLDITRRNRDIADTRLRESVVRTTANVKAAYWNLVSARATVEARRTAVQLAQELSRVNSARVEVGQSPPLDLLAAQAEVASNQEQLIIAETAVRQAEDQLRLLVLDPADPDAWTLTITPTEEPPVAMPAVDLDGAIAFALRDRADLLRARKDVENAAANVSYASSQRLPDVRLSGSYQANGLGGTQVLRTGGFPGTIVGPGQITSFGSILDQVFRRDYPTWVLGVNVSYPVGQSVEGANHARTVLEQSQARQRVKSAEAKAIQQIRDAAWRIEMNAKRIETARAARAFAERRMEVEQQRFEVGLSTSFLVIQAQRDLSQARANELAAVLAYDLALVNFEAIQQAAPAGQGGTGTAATTAAAAPAAAAAPPRTTGTGAVGSSGVPGF